MTIFKIQDLKFRKFHVVNLTLVIVIVNKNALKIYINKMINIKSIKFILMKFLIKLG